MVSKRLGIAELGRDRVKDALPRTCVGRDVQNADQLASSGIAGPLLGDLRGQRDLAGREDQHAPLRWLAGLAGPNGSHLPEALREHVGGLGYDPPPLQWSALQYGS